MATGILAQSESIIRIDWVYVDICDATVVIVPDKLLCVCRRIYQRPDRKDMGCDGKDGDWPSVFKLFSCTC